MNRVELTDPPAIVMPTPADLFNGDSEHPAPCTTARQSEGDEVGDATPAVSHTPARRVALQDTLRALDAARAELRLEHRQTLEASCRVGDLQAELVARDAAIAI